MVKYFANLDEENDEYIIINSIDYNVKLFKWV